MPAKIISLRFDWVNPTFWSFDDYHVVQYKDQKTGVVKIITTPKISEFEFGKPKTEYFTHVGAVPFYTESEAWEYTQKQKSN